MEEIEDLDLASPVTDREWARMQAQEWRDYADALEAYPGLAALRDEPEKFERALYDAVCVLDGTAADAGDDISWIEMYR